MTRTFRFGLLVSLVAVGLALAASRILACQDCDSNGYCFNSDNGFTTCRVIDFCELGGDQCGKGSGGPCPGCRRDYCGSGCSNRSTVDAMVRVMLLKLSPDAAARLFPSGATQRTIEGSGSDVAVSAVVGRIASEAGVDASTVKLSYFEMELGRAWFSTQGEFADGTGIAFRAGPTVAGVEAAAYQRSPRGFARVLDGVANDGQLLMARATMRGEPYVLVLSSVRAGVGDDSGNLNVKEEEFVSSARTYPGRDRLGWSAGTLDPAQLDEMVASAPGAAQTSWGRLKTIYH